MKIRMILFSLTMLLTILPGARLWAQSSDATTCVAECDRVNTVCHEKAQAALNACLSTATDHAERLACAAAFSASDDLCRTADQACIAACSN